VYVIPGIFLAKIMQYLFFTSFDPNLEMIISLAAIATLTPVLMMTMMKISTLDTLSFLSSFLRWQVLF